MNAEDRLLNFCGVLLVSEGMGETTAFATDSANPGQQLSLGNLPGNMGDLLIAGKRGTEDAAGKLEDSLYIFDSNGVCEGWSAPASQRCNIKLIQDVEGSLYRLNSEMGLLRLDDPNVPIIPPGELDLTDINEPRYDKPATIYVGIQDEDPDSFGRPILDVAFDADYVYVVPVVVAPDGNDPYTAAAKLQLLPEADPPYQVVYVYDDPPLPGDNQYRNALREVELDDAGNLYVLNTHSLNESDILWRYEPNGAIERLDLGIEDSNSYVPDPIAMYVSNPTDMLYLASAQDNPNDANSTIVYGFSTTGPLTLQRSVTITGMHHVTGITEDPATGSLWVAGFNMEDVPLYPNPAQSPFYAPYLAEIPYDSNDVELLSLSDSGSHDLALPMSILWTATTVCGGADLDHNGTVSFTDFAILANYWLDADCALPYWCAGADLDKNGMVDMADLAILVEHWLESGCLD